MQNVYRLVRSGSGASQNFSEAKISDRRRRSLRIESEVELLCVVGVVSVNKPCNLLSAAFAVYQQLQEYEFGLQKWKTRMPTVDLNSNRVNEPSLM